SDLMASYQKEASLLDQVIDRWKQLSSQLRDFRNGLRLSSASPLNVHDRMAEARAQFEAVSAAALSGDQDAIGKLQGVSQAYLDEARAYHANSVGYFSIFENVESILDQALAKAEAQVSEAEMQRSLLDQQVKGLININDSV